MTTTGTPVERRLRAFCRALAVIVCIGAAVELWLVEHTASFVQWIPFILCAIVIISVGLVSFGPMRETRGIITVHRLLMLLVIAGGAFGVYEHVIHNLTFAREIRPSAPARDIWLAGLRGANPLLAAAIFPLAAALGLAGVTGTGSVRK